MEHIEYITSHEQIQIQMTRSHAVITLTKRSVVSYLWSIYALNESEIANGSYQLNPIDKPTFVNGFTRESVK